MRSRILLCRLIQHSFWNLSGDISLTASKDRTILKFRSVNCLTITPPLKQLSKVSESTNWIKQFESRVSIHYLTIPIIWSYYKKKKKWFLFCGIVVCFSYEYTENTDVHFKGRWIPSKHLWMTAISSDRGQFGINLERKLLYTKS